MALRLIRLSRISHLYGSKLLRYYGNLKRPFEYAVLRLYHSALYFDVVFCQLRHTCVIVRYKISGRQFLDLYRKINVQNALLNYVLSHAKI